MRPRGAYDDYCSSKLNEHLRCLSQKRSPRREEALSSIVKAFKIKPQHEFVDKNFITLLYHCLIFIKKGSAKELELAPEAIGLMAMTIRNADNAREVYKDSIPALSMLLKTRSNSSKILHSLATVAFFSADNYSNETEEAMLLIWNFINPDCRNGSSTHPPSILAAAISSWCFLLSTLDGQRLSSKYWQEAISYFSDLLANEDEAVCEAASLALALIFETNTFEKFRTCEISASEKQEEKKRIIDKLRSQSNDISDVLSYFEERNCPDQYVKIGAYEVILSTWSQIIQLNFLKHFLGNDGFINHMNKNENFDELFDLLPEERPPPANKPYVPEREEVTVQFYNSPAIKVKKSANSSTQQMKKIMTMSPNSTLSKSRTKLLNKQRAVSEVMAFSCFAVED